MRFGTTARIAAGLAVVGIVVAVNQMSGPKTPRVLGNKITACHVGGNRVALGPQRADAQTLTVTVLHGKAVAALVPPVRLEPGAGRTAAPEAKPAASVSLGAARSTRKGVATLTVHLANASDCPIEFSNVRVTARRTASAVEAITATFSGVDKVLVRPGRSAKSRVTIDVKTDGSWAFNASATADVGASG